ncbi:MAG: glutamine--fructose-6-phosphate transaminase (isomerizing) [Bacillota bacterium]|nr:MAG: glutamine--fructose-6-phosphate transaminase (isomerizing) [Bacillota bacterium]
MCGIVGYIGRRPALPVIIDGLKRLEYRGYDSAGVAVTGNGRAGVTKTEGRIDALIAKLARAGAPQSTVGIGHTRWATHGRPSDANAHPHTDCSGQLAVVHNGVIENYLILRQGLEARGHKFRSETDTEVIAHLIEEHYNGDLVEAVRKVTPLLAGYYAFVVLRTDEPDRLVAVRRENPLIVGLGDDENFLASDIPAILRYTRRVVVLEDGDFVVVERSRVTVTDFAGNPVERRAMDIEWDAEAAEKGGFPHFMLKEIFEQPGCLKQTLAGRLVNGGPKGPSETGIIFDKGILDTEEVAALDRVFVTACGTAFHAGLVGKHLMEKLARLPVEADIASEFRYRDLLLSRGDLLVVVSQSGETLDTLAAQREAVRRGGRVVAITNVVGSSVAREADEVIYTRAGPEIAVCSTKAYTAQLLAFVLLATHMGVARGTYPADRAAEILHECRRLPELTERVLGGAPAMEELGERLAAWEDVFYIGRGLDYAVAMEGQLKLKEISYIHAEALAAGELKHGTLALIDKGVPVIALVTQPDLREKTISNVQVVKARGGHVIAVAVEGDDEIAGHADEVIYLPKTHPYLEPVLAAIPLQLIAYYAAVKRGCDVDKPRNLAKSVTVE